MRKIIISVALVSAILGASTSFAAKTTTTTKATDPGPAKNYYQIIQTINLLVNPNVGSPDTTASPIAIGYYAGDTLCWDSGLSPTSKAVPYKNYDIFGSCPQGDNCGCHLTVTRLDIIPQPVNGQVIYQPRSVVINSSSKITGTQVMIYQATPPSFDTVTGKVTPGTLEVKTQEQ